MIITPDNFTRIKHDVNGNPRFVCHYLYLRAPVDRDAQVTDQYVLAVNRARPLGGKRFHNKQYGGGIVFSSYNLRELCDRINHATGAANE